MIASTLLLSLLPPCVQESEIPGLIEIPAGRVMLGAEVDTIEKLLAEAGGGNDVMASETPRHRVEVPRFFISPTEVTNEMYLRFIQANEGYPPPASWAQLTREQRTEIIKEGKEKFGMAWILDDNTLGEWWRENWRDPQYQWEVTPEAALEPVVFVSYEDALAYCEWAGLRLPTEAEWTRAARGDGALEFPYGDEFDPTLVACRDTKPSNLRNKRLLVNSLPGNASPFGCVDMVGNVYEWTGSGFSAYKGFKPVKVKSKSGNRTYIPNFDASLAVIRGGSFLNPPIGVRLDTRAGISKTSRAAVLGFRVACSATPVEDKARAAVERVETRLLGGSAQRVLDLERPIGVERRYYADLDEIAAYRQPPGKGLPAAQPPAGYAVFDGYESIAMVPAKSIEAPSLDKLDRTVSDDGPVAIAVLTSTEHFEQPNLPSGTYILAYQAPMELEQIVALGATVPADDQDEAEKIGARLSDEAREKARAGRPDAAGIEFKPDEYYVIAINNANKVVAATKIEKPLLRSSRQARHETILNLDRGHLEYRIAVPQGRGSKSFEFRMDLTPLGPDGKSLARADYWSGNFEIRLPKEDKASTVVSPR